MIHAIGVLFSCKIGSVVLTYAIDDDGCIKLFEETSEIKPS
jgi:hypothetical protein